MPFDLGQVAQRVRRGVIMRVIHTLYFLAMALLVGTPSVGAQHSLSVPERIERAIRDNDPHWELVSIMVHKTREENYSYFRLKHAEQEIGIHVNEHDEPAHITPASLLTAGFRERTWLEGIGEEAYLLWSSPYSRVPNYDVVFISGNVRVHIEGGTAEVARRIAAYLADVLPPGNDDVPPA